MFNSKAADALWLKMCGAPEGFLASAQGKALSAKAVALLRAQGETADAAHLENLLTVAQVTDKLFKGSR